MAQSQREGGELKDQSGLRVQIEKMCARGQAKCGKLRVNRWLLWIYRGSHRFALGNNESRFTLL